MTYPVSLRWLCLGFIIFGVLSPFLVSFVGRGATGTFLAVAAWLGIALLPIIYPVIALKSGLVYGEGSTSHRALEPARFWIGLVTHEVLLLAFVLLAAFCLQVYLHPA
jgi:hypothetical protein